MKQISCEQCEEALFNVDIEKTDKENAKIIHYDDNVKILESNFSFTFDGVGDAESEFMYLCKNCKQKGSFKIHSTLYGLKI